ncbi:MAG TPA: helix-turn-helix domain-containing protein [Bacillales bacterium]|nr:helix-turn-helix domain-containing protein [Bacillales bacterium]
MIVNQRSLGSEIEFIRKQLGLSQQNLAKGICSQSEISRIEKGEILPRVDNIFQIAVKLQVDIPYLFSILLREKNKYIEETTKAIVELNTKKDYEEVYNSSKIELKRPPARDDFTFGLFLKWHYYVAAYETGKLQYETVIEALETLVSTKNFMVKQQFQDMQMKNAMAIIHSKNTAFEKSIPLFEEILSTNLRIREYDVFKTKVHYNYGKMLCDHIRYDSALKVVKRGIELTVQIKDISMLGNLYFQKGVCYEKLKYPQEKMLDCFEKAETIFRILDNQKYLKITQEKI